MIKVPARGEPIDGLYLPVADLVERFKAFDNNFQVKSDTFTGKLHIAPNQYVLELQGGKKTSAPYISGISPNNGPAAGGQVVTITGLNFVSGATVKFGSASGTSVIFDSSTQIRVTTPANLPNVVVTVTVTNPDSQLATYTYTYNRNAPTVTFWVANYSGGEIDPLVITGTGFYATSTTRPTVVFHGTTASHVDVISDTRIEARIPGSWNTGSFHGVFVLTVTNPDGQSGSLTVLLTSAGMSFTGLGSGGNVQLGVTYNCTLTDPGGYTGNVQLRLDNGPPFYTTYAFGGIILGSGVPSTTLPRTVAMTSGVAHFSMICHGSPDPNYGAGGFANGTLNINLVDPGTGADILINTHSFESYNFI